MIGDEFTGLALHDRAAMLGITSLEYLELAKSDARIFAQPATATSYAVRRLRRWLEAGRPAADLSRLVFRGADAVRELVRDVIASLPQPVAWHAVEHVAWFEVGRAASGWMALSAPMRAPQGDAPHMIVLDGDLSDDVLRGVIAHELGHSWHRMIRTTPLAEPARGMSEREVIAAVASIANYGNTTPEAGQEVRQRWIDDRVSGEVLADRQAAAWGIPPHGHDPIDLRRHFAATYDAGAQLATTEDETP